MEPRQAFSRSSLFSRRGFHPEYDGGVGVPGGAVPGRTTGSRYDRNRFAKLDLGNGSEASEVGRSPGYASYDRPALGLGLGLVDGLRLGLYDTGRTSYLDGGRPLMYESRRNGAEIDERIMRIFDDIQPEYDPSKGTHESEMEDPVGGDDPGGFAPDYEEEGGREVVESDAKFQLNDAGNKDRVWKSFVAPVRENDNVIYYRLIDNYMIYQLETVGLVTAATESGSSQSTVVAPDTVSSVFQKASPLLEELSRCSSSFGDVTTVDGKLVLIKNMKVLIEELQQKVAKLQADVQGKRHCAIKKYHRIIVIDVEILSVSSSSSFSSSSLPLLCSLSFLFSIHFDNF